MAKVVNPNEVELNGVRYPILSKVRPSLISQFPSKIVIGDYSKESEQIASSWVISDQRGGILVEEMEESIHQGRCLWSTANLNSKGHIILPPLVTDCGDSKYTSATAWAANTAYTTVEAVKPTAYNGYWYQCTTAGTSHATTEPVWGTTEGGTTADSTVVWTCRKGDCFVLFELGGYVYGIFDRFCQKFDNTNDDFEDTEHEFLADPTDVMIFGGAALVAFSDSANIQQKGLPSLELNRFIDNHRFDEWAAGYPTGWGFDIPTDGSVAQNTDNTFIQEGLFSVKLNSGAADAAYMRQKLPFSNVLRSKVITVTAYGAEQAAGDNSYLRVKDGVGNTQTEFTVSATKLHQTTVVHTMNAAATFLEIEIECDFGGIGTEWLYVDKVEISIAGFTDWLDMQEAGKYFTSLGYTMYMIDVDGKLYTSKAGIEWVYKATIPVPFGGVSSMYIDRDAFSTMTVYVGTQVGTFAYDDSLEELVQTDLQLPEHPTAALHPTNWRLGIYVPAGLDVLHYIAGTTAVISSVGLDKEGGMPAEYRGEITYLVKAYNEMFALVDSTYGDGTSKSALMSYDGNGWQCRWVSSTANKAMKCALVTSAYDEYRVFWGADNKVYHMTMQRNLLNPLKISSYPFALNAEHITPWFDGSVAWNKLAIELELFCSGITDDEEEVTVEYRINHSNADLTTGWTSLGTIEANGSTTLPFGSSAGIAFRNIQFRFYLDRDAGDNTLTPDIQEVKFKYLKLLPPLWGWTFTIDCTKKYDGRSGRQLIEALIAAAETETLLNFVFTDVPVAGTVDAIDTRKVKIKSIIGDIESGAIKEGKYQVQVIEV